MHVHSGPRASTNPSGVLKISSLVTLAYIVLLVIAGFRAHSLALLAEAGHNLSDFLALLLSLTAVYLRSEERRVGKEGRSRLGWRADRQTMRYKGSVES